MADRVKGKRRYDSPRRREQAAATRSQILDAAQRLFERHGYAATTMQAIATEAGVALKTVYVAFETKSNLLRTLWNLRLRGDEEEVAVPQREWYREVLEEPDPDRQLRLNARNARAVKERLGGLFAVIRGGASADPEIAALWKRIQDEFHAAQRGIVESVAAKGALRSGLDVDRATDIVWTLNHPDPWLLLRSRGWTPEEWEAWFSEASRAQLLGGEPVVPSARK